MNYRSSLTALFVAYGVVGFMSALAASPAPAPDASGKNNTGATLSAAAPAASTTALAAAKSPASAATAATQSSAKPAASAASLLASSGPKASTDAFSAFVIDDAQLAKARGGSDTHTNTNNATGTVSGNVASQLTTGSNSISSSSFSNTSGIPMVIQNTGNNVLIQNSTILNLQLTSPK